MFWPIFSILFVCASRFMPVWEYIFHEGWSWHQLCLAKLDFDTPLRDIYQSLVCGKRLSAGPVKSLITKGGLIHLMVISGAHLLFLEKFWSRLPLPRFIKANGLFVILLLYAFCADMRPPVVRALFSFSLFEISRRMKLFWSSWLITCLSACLCLFYQPLWAFSFSMQLSLLAAFLMSLSGHSLKKSFFIYMFILPVINRWQALHPLTVLINWMAVPVIGGVLFPLSLISPLFSPMYAVTDRLWFFALKILSWVKFLPQKTPVMDWFIPEQHVWAYVCAVALIVLFFETFKRRFYLHPQK